jgi:hypothetical protein
MVICFECPSKTKLQLDQLLERGAYSDYGDALVAAVANLAVIERHVEAHGPLALADRDERPAAASLTKPSGLLPHKFFKLDGVASVPPVVAAAADDPWAKDQDVPLERWIFGQYNKLLPVKASCRALAVMLSRERTALLLKDAAEKVSDAAAVLGNALRSKDETSHRHRDDWLSTAFPVIGSRWNKEKAIKRYANHFVASMANGKIAGLLADLRLINQVPGPELRIALTEQGWRFAALPNPILDAEGAEAGERFTDEEKAFLLEHILNHVSVERFAYRSVLTALVGDDAYTPNSLDAVLQRYGSPSRKEFSKSFVTSQRSGAISRMADLGLVARIRNGVNTTYSVLRSGREYLGAVKTI